MPVGTRNSVIAGGGCHHIAVAARDWEASLALYVDVLGMTKVTEFQAGGPGGRTVLILDMGDGSHMELFEPLSDTPVPGSDAPNDPVLHFALATTDARSSTEHVRRAGYKITVEPRDVDLAGLKATISFFEGPSGEIIEFFEVQD